MQEAMLIIDGNGTLEDLNDELRDGLKVIHCCSTKNENGNDAIFVVTEETAPSFTVPVENRDKLMQKLIDRIDKAEKEIERLKEENEDSRANMH